MYLLFFLPLRACEPADSLVSLVSTNNLMLVIFKAAQVKEQKEFHGYFEVITQESRFVLCLQVCIWYCFFWDPEVSIMFLTMEKMIPVSEFLLFTAPFISSALLLLSSVVSSDWLCSVKAKGWKQPFQQRLKSPFFPFKGFIWRGLQSASRWGCYSSRSSGPWDSGIVLKVWGCQP